MKVNVTLTTDEIKPIASEYLRNKLALDKWNDTLDVNVELPKPEHINYNLATNIEARNSNKIYLIKMIREAQSAHFKSPNGETCMGLSQAKAFVEAYLAPF